MAKSIPENKELLVYKHNKSETLEKNCFIPEHKHSQSTKIKNKSTRGRKVKNKDNFIRSVDDWYFTSFHLSSTNKKLLCIVL